MSELYTIMIPGRVYGALREREAMVNNDPASLDMLARAAFMAAKPKLVGRGHSYVITGTRELTEHILAYIDSLIGLAKHGIVPAYEFRTDIKGLRKISEQEPQPVPRETSEGVTAP